MRWIFSVLFLGWMVAEGLVLVTDPFHAPLAQLPMRLFGLQIYRGADATMAPTVAEGDYVVVSAWPYRGQAPAAGDIVILDSPATAGQELLRRVVATPGSTVEIRNGVMLVDGQARAEPWLRDDPPDMYRSLAMRARELPAGCYFVLGDNRDISIDSRNFGCVRREAIHGRKW